MLSITVYNFIHIVGLIMIFTALGGAATFAANGGAKENNTWRKKIAITHGVGLFLMLLGGFGMLARLQIHFPWPGWITAKFIIWLVLGGCIALSYRKPVPAFALAIAAGIAAAFLALWKPI